MSIRVLLEAFLFDAAEARKPEDNRIIVTKLTKRMVLVMLIPKFFVAKTVHSKY
jgi:hypothetical protein